MKKKFLPFILILTVLFVGCHNQVNNPTPEKIEYALPVWKGEFEVPPESPKQGWIYYNLNDKCTYIFDGEVWQILARDGTDFTGNIGDDQIIWKGSLENAPELPEKNCAYFNFVDGNAYIYNGAEWEYLSKDRKLEPSVVLPDETNSIIWKGEMSQAPENPEINWVYSTDKESYIFDGSKWILFSASCNTNLIIKLKWISNKPVAPKNPEIGLSYYNITLEKSFVWTGSVWEELSCKTSDSTLIPSITDKQDNNLSYYKVFHYKQNPNDDDYKIDVNETQLLPGIVGKKTEAWAKDFFGFYAKPFTQLTVTSDEIAIVNIYYDREIVSCYFEAKDGSFEDTTETVLEVSGRYGADLIPPVAFVAGKHYGVNWIPEPPKTFNYDVTEFKAEWYELDSYSVIYKNLALSIGGSAVNNNPDIFYPDEEIVFADPKNKPFRFLGWYTDKDYTSEPVTKIPKGTNTNVTLYARWETDYSIIPSYEKESSYENGEEYLFTASSDILSDSNIIKAYINNNIKDTKHYHYDNYSITKTDLGIQIEAVYKLDTFTIRYHLGSLELGTDEIVYDDNSVITETYRYGIEGRIAYYIYDYYIHSKCKTFAEKYNTKPDGSGEVFRAFISYNDDESTPQSVYGENGYILESDIDLYAQYQYDITDVVSYRANNQFVVSWGLPLSPSGYSKTLITWGEKEQNQIILDFPANKYTISNLSSTKETPIHFYLVDENDNKSSGYSVLGKSSSRQIKLGDILLDNGEFCSANEFNEIYSKKNYPKGVVFSTTGCLSETGSDRILIADFDFLKFQNYRMLTKDADALHKIIPTSRTDGSKNWQIIKENTTDAISNPERYPAFVNMENFEDGGWYIPAIEELNTFEENFSLIEESFNVCLTYYHHEWPYGRTVVDVRTNIWYPTLDNISYISRGCLIWKSLTDVSIDNIFEGSYELRGDGIISRQERYYGYNSSSLDKDESQIIGVSIAEFLDMEVKDWGTVKNNKISNLQNLGYNVNDIDVTNPRMELEVTDIGEFYDSETVYNFGMFIIPIRCFN